LEIPLLQMMGALYMGNKVGEREGGRKGGREGGREGGWELWKRGCVGRGRGRGGGQFEC
jgi:hypothetical protein